MNARHHTCGGDALQACTAPLRSSLVYRDFVIDANHKSPACLDASSMRESHVQSTSRAKTLPARIIGCASETALLEGYGQNYDMQIGPIKIVSPYAYTALANVTANVVGGAISTMATRSTVEGQGTLTARADCLSNRIWRRRESLYGHANGTAREHRGKCGYFGFVEHGSVRLLGQCVCAGS